MEIISIVIGLLAGSVIAYIIFYLFNKTKTVSAIQFKELNSKYIEANSTVKILEEKTNNLQTTNTDLNTKLNTKETEYANILIKLSSTETQLKNEEAKISDLNLKLKTEIDSNKNQQEEINKHKQKISELNANNNSISDNLSRYSIANDKQTKQIEDLSLKLIDLISQLSTLTANNSSLTDKLNTQKAEVEELQKTAHLQFETIANKLFEEKSSKFTETNKINLENLLNPLKEDIGKFKTKVEETHTEDTKQRVSLEERIKGLIDQTNRVSTEANNLATALKGKPQKRGNWGEMILERILEMSGLTKDREYFVQGSIKDEEGNNLRPDIRINLPDQRVIMIDSKVSLVAYDNFSSTENIEEQKIYLAKHLESTNAHIEQLSSKNYDNLVSSLDFTMMFIPIEPAYMITIQSDQNIWARAYEKRILLVSPTNLIACLKLFSDLWKRDNQSKNALKIVKQGEALYDKFVTFTKTFEEVGNSIKSSQEKYEKALGQLKEGRGNLINQGVQFKNLGLKSDKRFSENLLAESAEYTEETETKDDHE